MICPQNWSVLEVRWTASSILVSIGYESIIHGMERLSWGRGYSLAVGESPKKGGALNSNLTFTANGRQVHS